MKVAVTRASRGWDRDSGRKKVGADLGKEAHSNWETEEKQRRITRKIIRKGGPMDKVRDLILS